MSKFIVIEGPIGVGKSTLARKLAKTLGCKLLLERPGDNPFLERFYKSPKRFALPTQLFFLFQRIRQVEDTKQEDIFNPGRVADFMLEKDQIFAQLTLGDDELRLYQQVYKNLVIDRAEPDLVIYLQAPVEVLQARIKKRRVKYEQNMDASYLQRLCDAYAGFFYRFDKAPLLIVNAAELNYVDNESHYDALVEHIQTIGAGKHYFNPLVEAL